MSMRAIANEYTFKLGWPPVAVAATKTSAAIDLANAIENVFILEYGLWTDGTHTPTLTYCSTSGGTYTTVAAADLVGSFTAVNSTTLAANGGSYIHKVSYIGPYQFIKFVDTVAGATTGAIIGAHALVKLRKQTSST